MSLKSLAKELKTTPQDLLQEGIFAYLQRKLNDVSIEIESLKRKWNVDSAKEFNQAIKKGEVHEFSKNEDASEDFYRLSHLEEQKKHLLELVKKHAQ